MAFMTRRRRERKARRILHRAWCLPKGACRNRSAHRLDAYAPVGAAVAAAPDRAAVLDILHRRKCVATMVPTIIPQGCEQTVEHLAALAATPYVLQLFRVLRVH